MLTSGCQTDVTTECPSNVNMAPLRRLRRRGRGSAGASAGSVGSRLRAIVAPPHFPKEALVAPRPLRGMNSQSFLEPGLTHKT
jgi:hypothetical protein